MEGTEQRLQTGSGKSWGVIYNQEAEPGGGDRRGEGSLPSWVGTRWVIHGKTSAQQEDPPKVET